MRVAEWIKLRAGLEDRLEVVRLAHQLSLTTEATVHGLYKLAGWFTRHGDYGKMKGEPWLIDAYLKVPGFAAELTRLNWLVCHANGVMTLRWFCATSTTRKSIGKKRRYKILDSGVCAVCGRPDSLEIDHKTPISRGGSCDDANLQPLCIGCNRRKGAKTMEEFRA